MVKVYNKNNIAINESEYIKLYSYDKLVCKFDKNFKVILLDKNRNKTITTEKHINQFLEDYKLLDYKIIE